MHDQVGLDPKYFIAAINDYKGGQRKNKLMKSMAVAISDANALNSMKLVPFLIFRMGAQLAAPVERASGD